MSARTDYLERLARAQGVFVSRDGDKLVVKGPIKKTFADEKALRELDGAPETPPPEPPMDWAEADLRAHEPEDDEGEVAGIAYGPVSQYATVPMVELSSEEALLKAISLVVVQLRELAEEILPAGAVYEIHRQPNIDYGRALKVEWSYAPHMSSWGLADWSPRGEDRDGVLRLGVFKVPEK